MPLWSLCGTSTAHIDACAYKMPSCSVSGTGRDDENGPRDENANRGPERHEMTIYHGQLPGGAWA